MSGGMFSKGIRRLEDLFFPEHVIYQLMEAKMFYFKEAVIKQFYNETVQMCLVRYGIALITVTKESLVKFFFTSDILIVIFCL